MTGGFSHLAAGMNMGMNGSFAMSDSVGSDGGSMIVGTADTAMAVLHADNRLQVHRQTQSQSQSQSQGMLSAPSPSPQQHGFGFKGRPSPGGTRQDFSAASYKRLASNSLSSVDPQRRVEQVRREQNEVLLRVLDEERRAEENRVHFMRQALLSHPSSRAGGSGVSHEERRQLEVVFAEERRAASERIVNLTKANEQTLKSVVVNLLPR
jgi:hypothetical protein